MNGQPNFLLVITDQQQAGHLGCYGNRVLRTPHIDALAASGVRAERCYVASPICMPNRASLMTGRMPSVHGVRHNGIELSLGETTFVDALREAGWQTAIAGKSHLQCIHEAPAQVPPDPKSRLAREARRKLPGRYNQELGTAWEKNPAHDLFYPYYGFERAHLTVQHGDAQYGHWRRWLRSQLPDADRLIGPENATPTPGLELSRCRQAWRTRLPEELYPNAWITDRTIDLLREFARGGKPFFIQCSYPDPHHPFTPPGRYWSLYSPEDVPAPPSFHAEHRNVPPHVQWLHAMRDAGKAVKHTQAPFACSEREAREAIALNYGTISQIDDGVGRIEAELGRLGLERNTIVLFTSDHGDFMGDHQLLLKGPIHYRGLIRVPFIWKDPRGPSGRVTDSLVQTTDFAPTILERAGVAPWNGIQGKSLLAAFADDGKAPHESLLVEEEGQRVYLGFAGRVRMRSLVTRSHRLSIYDGVDWGELYDFADDPHECVNRWDDPGRSRVRAELVEQLAHRMLEYSETSPYPDYIA